MKLDKKRDRASEFPVPLKQFAGALMKQTRSWVAAAEDFNGCILNSTEGKMVADPFAIERVLTRATADLVGQLVVPVEVKDWVIAEKTRVSARFEQDLREFCQFKHVQIEGRYPSYTVAEFVTVEVLSPESMILVNDVKIPSLMFHAAQSALEEAISESTGSFSPEKFILELSEASRRACRVDDTMSLDGMPIKAVFRELVFVKQQGAFFKNPIRSNYVEYTLKAFARDLSRLMRCGVVETKDGKKLNLGPTSTADGVTIHFEGSARKIGRIGFLDGGR